VSALPEAPPIATAAAATAEAAGDADASREELARRANELARLEELTASWDDSQLRVLAAIKTGIEELNAEAFRRLIRALKRDGGADTASALHRAVRDPLLFQVLHFHGLVKEPVEHRVARALEEVRPFLATHGGDVELVAVRLPDTVEVRLVGSCQSCPSAGETLSEGVEKAIFKHCPEIVHVKRVSRSAPEATGSNGARVVRFISPFARRDDVGWTDVCALEDLRDGAVVSREVVGRDLLFYRAGDVLSCFDNACAHMGMPLDGGHVDNGQLTCPYHGFTYRLDTGECVTVPEVQLAVHAVKLSGDRVAVKLSA
jgi:nitrite reductase/ring-hydroxylating ferredoxin subunit/Fe-S cluster biogenesis protein NfuA